MYSVFNKLVGLKVSRCCLVCNCRRGTYIKTKYSNYYSYFTCRYAYFPSP